MRSSSDLVVVELRIVENNLESVGEKLEWGVGIVARIRIFDGILDLFELPFDGLIHIFGCIEAGVVLGGLGGGDVVVRRLHMREHLAGGDVGIAGVAGSDITEEDVVDSAGEELF